MFSRNITRSVSLKFWKPAAKPLAPTVGPVTSDFADDHRKQLHSVIGQARADDQHTASSANSIPSNVSQHLNRINSDVIDMLLEPTDSEQRMMSSTLTDNTVYLSGNLQEMAKYYFSSRGKQYRPTISLLMSCAFNRCVSQENENITLNQYRIAMISEMIHTASLIHDDVIDKSNVRRGKPTANARWGNRQAVLVGDYILSRATKLLSSIGHPQVISSMAEVVEDLVKGELMQLNIPASLGAVERFNHYMLRIFYKSASLFANSCKSVAILSGVDECQQRDAYEFGKNLGLAFQLIDDVLDYVSSSAVLGKPTLSDLKQGLATCPVLFAAKEFPELNQMINRRFAQDNDVENAYAYVLKSNGLESTRRLAKEHCDAALKIAEQLPSGKIRECLTEILLVQLARDK